MSNGIQIHDYSSRARLSTIGLLFRHPSSAIKKSNFMAFFGSLVCLTIVLVPSALAQRGAKRPLRTTGPPLAQQKTILTFSNQPGLQSPEMINAFLDPPSLMQFTLDWTNCQMHRTDDYLPIVITLPGTINASGPLLWNLTSAQPQVNSPPILYFTEDIFGRSGLPYGMDIPLTWEISLDGGPFAPMTLLPDNTLTATFPPGPHTFQVRITGTPVYHQADGYYHLQLTQCLVPQL